MGFLWFGKNVDSWKDIGSSKELKDQKIKLEVEWDINLAKKEEVQRLYSSYRTEAAKEGINEGRRNRAAHEMSQQTKRQRRLDEEINLIQTNLDTVVTVLGLKDAEERDNQLSKVLGEMDPNKLQDALIGATQARREKRDFIKEVHTIVTSHSSPISIEAEKDDDYRTALEDIKKTTQGN